MIARFLLDLDLGGRILRVSTSAVEVDGFLYLEGLELDQFVVDSDAVRVVIDTEPTADGWADWWARRGPLEDLPATLWWKRDDREAKKLLEGRLVGGGVGAPGEPLEGRLVRSELGEDRWMPDPANIVRTSQFAFASEQAIGLHAPVVLGYPGTSQAGSNEYGCVPAPLVRTLGNGQWLVGHDWISASQVDLHRIAGGLGVFAKWSNAPVLNITTTEGQKLSIVGGTPPASFLVDDGVYLASHDRADPGDSHGGIGAPDGRTLRGAAEVLRWVLARFSSIPVDDARWDAVADVLDGYKVDTFVDEPIRAWEWITRSVLPWLPVKVCQGPEGLFLRLHRYRCTEADVVRTLSADRGEVERVSGIEARHELYNVFALEFCHVRGSFRARRVLDDEGPVGAGGPATPDVLYLQRADLQRSVDRFRRRVMETKQCPITWDSATAGRMLSDLADKHGWPQRAVQYAGAVDLDEVEPSTFVRIVDSEVRISERALVERVILSVEEVILDLTVLDSPLSIQEQEVDAACVPPQFLLCQFDPNGAAPEVGGSLRVQTSYTGSADIVVTYAWYVDGGATLLVGETTDTLDPIPASAAGNTVQCSVTITNACGFQLAVATSASVPVAAASPADLTFQHWYDAKDGAVYVDVSGTDRLVSIADKGTVNNKATAGVTGAPKTSTTINGASQDVPGPFGGAQSHDCRATGLGRTGVTEWTAYAIVPLDDTGSTLNTYAAIRSTTIADFWFQLKNGSTNAVLQISGDGGFVEFDGPRDAAYAAGSSAIVIVRRVGGRVKVDVWYDIGAGVVKPAQVDVADWYSGAYEVEDVAVGGRGTTTASWNQSYFHEWAWKDSALTDPQVEALSEYAANVLGWTLP